MWMDAEGTRRQPGTRRGRIRDGRGVVLIATTGTGEQASPFHFWLLWRRQDARLPRLRRRKGPCLLRVSIPIICFDVRDGELAPLEAKPIPACAEPVSPF